MSEGNPGRRSRVPFAWLIDWWLRSWRRIALVLVVSVAAVLVVRAVANVWIGHRLNQEISRLEKVYGRLDPASLAPPRVAPSENRARVMRAAANLTTVDVPAAFHESIWSGGRRSGEVIGSISRDQKVVDDNRLAVHVAEQGRRRSKSNWDIDYARDDANFPRLLDIRTLGEILAVTCRVDLDAGRTDEAAEAALAGLAEASSLSGEPVLIIQLVRIATARTQLECVRDLLQRAEPPPAVLVELAASLAENRTTDPMHIALVGELKHVNKVFAEIERGNMEALTGVGPSGAVALRPVWAVSWLSRPLIRAGHLRYLQEMGRQIELQAVPPFARRPSDATAGLITSRPRWWELARQIATPFLAGQATTATDYEYQSALNAADIAVALRRFRVDRGGYPDSLTELAPQYLAKVPVDPFTGQPPEYKRDGAGFDLRAHAAPGRPANKLLEWKISR